MLVGNSKSCEACVKQDVCKYASTRKEVLKIGRASCRERVLDRV